MEKKKFIKVLNLTLSSFAYWFFLLISTTGNESVMSINQLFAIITMILGLTLSGIYFYIMRTVKSKRIQNNFFWI